MKKVILKKNSFLTGMSSSSSSLFSSSTSPLNGSIWRPYSNERDLNHDNLGYNTLDEHPHDGASYPNCFVDIPLDFSGCKKFKVDDNNHVNNFRPTIKAARHTDDNNHKVQPPSISTVNRIHKKATCLANPDNKSDALVHNLPSNECNFSTANNNNNKRNLNHFQQPQQTEKIVSKIDLMERKLKAKRLALYHSNKATHIDDYDLSDSALSLSDYDDTSEEEQIVEEIPSKLKAKLIITKGPPLKLDTSGEKLNFMKSLGLITHKDKQDLEFQKFCSEYERRRQKSLSNETNVAQRENQSDPLKVLPTDQVLLEPSHILPSSINSFKSNGKVQIRQKFQFMSALGLQFEKDFVKIKERELEWQGILKERERRKSLNLCFAKLLDNISKETLNEWFESLSSHTNRSKNGYTDPNSDLRFASHAAPLHKRLINYQRTSQKASREVDKSDFLTDRSWKTTASSGNSVLFLDGKQSNISPYAKSIKSFSSHNLTNDFKWPGIEAIIESYRKYSIGKY